VTPAECNVNPDELGDTDEAHLRVQLRRGGARTPLVSVVDYNADGMIKDGW